MAVTADVVVVGLGAMGAASAWQLARRGMSVVGIDRYHPPHNLGSSHAGTRITRIAIGEGDRYVPMVRRAHEIWREIERETSRELLHQIGGLIFGKAGDTNQHGVADFLKSTVQAAEKFGVPHERLSADDIRERFPQFNVAGDESGYYEPEAGYLLVDNCIQSQLDLARRSGAVLNFHEPAESITAIDGGGYSVVTQKETYHCQRVAVCSGAWVSDLVSAKMGNQFQVFRQVLYWLKPTGNPSKFSPDRFPVFIRLAEDVTGLLYGFPELNPGQGVKVGRENFDHAIHPDERVLEVAADEIADTQRLVIQHMPELGGNCIDSASCLYTCTQDFQFVIEDHPGMPGCLIVSACSGHGFKHSAAIGEEVANRLSEK